MRDSSMFYFNISINYCAGEAWTLRNLLIPGGFPKNADF